MRRLFSFETAENCDLVHESLFSESHYFLRCAMNKIVTAAEANRGLSKLLRSVREGDSFIVTSHGTPVARLVPIEDDTARREDAKQRYLDGLRSQPALNLPKWTRDELYDD